MHRFTNFFDQYPVKFIKKGQVILHQNDIPTAAYVIKNGVVKVCNLTSNGEEKSLSFKVTGDIFPVCWIFSKTTSALFYYQAHTDCELYVADRKDITDFIDTNHDFAKFILDKQVVSYVNSELQVEALEQSRAQLKLLYTFRHLALTHGIELKKDRVKISIPLTQQDLANFTGLTRETTTLEISKLSNDKIIRVDRKFYIVNTSKVNDIIDDEYDPGVKIQYLP